MFHHTRFRESPFAVDLSLFNKHLIPLIVGCPWMAIYIYFRAVHSSYEVICASRNIFFATVILCVNMFWQLLKATLRLIDTLPIAVLAHTTHALDPIGNRRQNAGFATFGHREAGHQPNDDLTASMNRPRRSQWYKQINCILGAK